MSTLTSSNIQVGQSITPTNNITLNTSVEGDLVINKGVFPALTEISRIKNNGEMVYTPAGTGAVATTVQDQLRNLQAWDINVKDAPYYAKGDGVTDDTAAFTAALATGKRVFVPNGTFIIGSPIYVIGLFNATRGVYTGGTLVGAGSATILKAKAGYSASYMILVGNKDYATTPTYSINNFVGNFTIDNSNMPNTTSYSGMYFLGTYNNQAENIQLTTVDGAYLRWDLTLGRGVYTTRLSSVHGNNINISSDTDDFVTTITIVHSSWTFINIVNALAINFVAPTIQGKVSQGFRTNKIQITTSYNVKFDGGDFEGNGVLFTVTSSRGIYVNGNNLGNVDSPMTWGNRITQFTATISGTTMNVTATALGTLAIGQYVYGFGVLPGTQIVGGSAPNWTVNLSQSLTQSTALSGTLGLYYSDGGGNSRVSLMDNFSYLDDTSFTPSFSSAGSPTYTTQIGVYQRVGQRINFNIHLAWTGATAGFTPTVVGLPAPLRASLSTTCQMSASGITAGAGKYLQAFMPATGSQINIQNVDPATGATGGPSGSAAGSLFLSGSYISSSY